MVLVERQRLRIPLVNQLDYLGIGLSYGNFEDLIWRRRQGVAQASFERIRKILLGHHVLSLMHRVKLWRTIVVPSACYGLLGIGWSQAGFERKHGMYMKHLRLISRSPVHLTKEPNEDLLLCLGLSDLGDHIAQMADRTLLYHRELKSYLDPRDVICAPVQLDWCYDMVQSTQAGLDRFRKLSASASSLPSTVLPHSCEFCTCSYATIRDLRIHQKKAHSKDLPEDWNRSQVTPENVRFHAVDGMPTCSYCLAQFKNWQNLYMHSLQSRCRVLAEQLFDSSPQPASAGCYTALCPETWI